MIVTLIAALVTQGELPIPQGDVSTTTIKTILQVVFGFAGAIALLVIARAAFRYTISQGEPQKIAKEKDAIIYAVVGLVVSILAFSLVSFFIGHIK